jgi:hypothetical protein
VCEPSRELAAGPMTNAVPGFLELG